MNGSRRNNVRYLWKQTRAKTLIFAKLGDRAPRLGRRRSNRRWVFVYSVRLIRSFSSRNDSPLGRRRQVVVYQSEKENRFRATSERGDIYKLHGVSSSRRVLRVRLTKSIRFRDTTDRVSDTTVREFRGRRIYLCHARHRIRP